MPSTQANPTKRVAKFERLSFIHLIAQSPFFLIQSNSFNALNNFVF